MELKSVTDRARLAEEKAAVEREASLRRIATLVAGGATPGELFAAVAREVSVVLHAPVVTVDRYELEDGLPVSVVLASLEDPAFPAGGRWPLDGPSARAWIYETGRPVRIEDWSGLESTVAAAVRQQGMSWVVGAPIVVDGAVWGNICAGTTGDEPIPDDAESRLADFTDLISTAIANSDAREKVRRLLDEQAALRRVATLVAEGDADEELFAVVAREVADLFGAGWVNIDRYENGESVVLATFDDPGFLWPSNLASRRRRWRVGSRWPLDRHSLRTLVYETGRPARFDGAAWAADTSPAVAQEWGIRSAVAAPIMVEGNVWGVLGIASKEDEPLPADTEQRLAAFTELVSTAIANAQSRGELAASEARARELAEEQAGLRRVATLVAKGASADELFSAVAKEVADVIAIPIAVVHRYEGDGTFTILGIAGEVRPLPPEEAEWPEQVEAYRPPTPLTVGSRMPVLDDGITGLIRTTGRPVRKEFSVGVPIVVEGSIWGFMIVADRSGRPVPAGTEERLGRFTELLATAVSNASTRTELLTSRARVVSAADEARRRLERDLHDGIQQWLVALALRARKAAGSAAGDSAAQDLAGLADELVAVTDELRELSRGIHPAILSDAGLDDALKALARRSAIQVDLDVSFQGRYDPILEATVYYVVAESITNAVKHAQASTLTVRGGGRDGVIELEIRDDGVGGADPARGTGLIGLKDRVDTLGGTISFASSPGAGTAIHVLLPASDVREDPPIPRSDTPSSAPASG